MENVLYLGSLLLSRYRLVVNAQQKMMLLFGISGIGVAL